MALTKSQQDYQNFDVDFSTADGSATAGNDYQSNAGKKTFFTGAVNEDIIIQVKQDAAASGTKTFEIDLSKQKAEGAFSPSKAMCTIVY